MQDNSRQQLETLYKIIFHILNARAPHMMMHISRVPVLANMIAETLQKDTKIKLSSEALYQLEMASKLHDCGKTTTPDYLLSKST